jgi:hypothetical protein
MLYGRQRLAVRELGTPAEARLRLRPGALPRVWAGDTADHCCHHPSRRYPHDAAPSEARR